MTREEYITILQQHGRRVANRVAFASAGLSAKPLADFYACYAPEDTLPDGERCTTNMVNKFDPVGWFVYYEGPSYDLWPAPEANAEDIE